MKRFNLLFTMALFIMYAVPIKAKTQKVCPMLKFEGEVVKNKITKQREPSGMGILYVSKNSRENFIEFEGLFNGEAIDDATLTFGENHYFKGKVTYSYNYNKKDEILGIKVDFVDGTLYWEKDDGACVSAKLNKQSKLSGYKFIFEKGNYSSVVYHIRPDVSEFDYESDLSPSRLRCDVGSMLSNNVWHARWGNAKWVSTWQNGTMDNGMKVKRAEKDKDYFSFYGDNDTYLYYDYDGQKLKLRMPLKSGGFFELDNYNQKEQTHIGKITYPSGDSYLGTFSKAPFDLTESHYYYQNVPKLFGILADASISDFTLNKGIYTYADGKKDYVSNGQFIGDKISKANGGKVFSSFDEIVDSHIYAGDSYAIYTNGNYKTSEGKAVSGSKGKDILEKISVGILHYTDTNISDKLDEELYLKSAKYQADKEVYDSLRTTLCFYTVVTPTDFVFSTEGFKIELKYLNYNSKMGIVKIEDAPWMPYKGKLDGHRLNISTSDLEVLKLLKDSQKSLKLLVTFKAGEYNRYLDWNNHYYTGLVGKPIGLYLYDSVSGIILYDMSYLWGIYSSEEIQAKSKVADRQEKAEREREDARREAEWRRKYGPNAEPCMQCYGTGIYTRRVGNNYHRQFCPYCNGTGVVNRR